MQELGHDWVDVLKIDIEGAEWEVLDSILRTPGIAPFTQLQVAPASKHAYTCKWMHRIACVHLKYLPPFVSNPLSIRTLSYLLFFLSRVSFLYLLKRASKGFAHRAHETETR